MLDSRLSDVVKPDRVAFVHGATNANGTMTRPMTLSRR